MQKYNLGNRSLAIRSFVRLLDKDRNDDISPFNLFAIHLLNSFLLNLLGCKRDSTNAAGFTRFVGHRAAGLLESDICRSRFVSREEFFQLLKGILV
jgi:hypothetical protein